MRLVTWNVLAQCTIPEELQEMLAWSKRLPFIIEYLKQTNADFICLQEIDLNTFESDFKDLINIYKFARHAVCIKGKHKRTNTFGNVTMWKIGQMISVQQGSRTLHVNLQLDQVSYPICISNLHFPAKPGLEGYLEKRRQLISCIDKWKTLDVIVVGDFNDGLCFKDDDNEPAGLCADFKNLGFLLPEEELKKETCKSFRGRVYNVDHAISRANINTTYIPQPNLNIQCIPNEKIPSDHLPLYYLITLKEIIK